MSTTTHLSDQTKLGLLVVGCVCVALVIGYEVMGPRFSPVARSHAEVAKPSDTPMKTATYELREIEVPTYQQPLTSDPFRTIFADSAPRTVAQVRMNPPQPNFRPEIAIGGPIQPFVPKIDGIVGATGSMADLGLRVDGVIAGKGGVAVVKFGPDVMVLRPGERFGDDMVVRSITTTHVTFSKGKQTIKVPVEGTVEPRVP